MCGKKETKETLKLYIRPPDTDHQWAQLKLGQVKEVSDEHGLRSFTRNISLKENCHWDRLG